MKKYKIELTEQQLRLVLNRMEYDLVHTKNCLGISEMRGDKFKIEWIGSLVTSIEDMISKLKTTKR